MPRYSTWAYTLVTVAELAYTDADQLALSKQGLEESLDKLVAIYV